MLKKTVLCVLVLFVLLSGFVKAQTENPQTSVFKPSETFNRPKGFLSYLIDPSKFSMSHSYTVSYFSLGGEQFSQGLYLNTMNYRVSNPLLMQVRIGYLHRPFGSSGWMNEGNGKVFVQRAMLEYKPSDNMWFRIDYQAMPYSTMMYPYDYRW